MSDGMFPDGGRHFMKSHFMDELTDEAIRTLVDNDARRPTPESLIVIRSLGGAVARVPADDSAYAHRSARVNVSMEPAWPDPRPDDAAIGWSRSTWDAVLPFSTGGTYVNFAGLGDDAEALRPALFGGHEERLDRIRGDYDPQKLFTAPARRP